MNLKDVRISYINIFDGFHNQKMIHENTKFYFENEKGSEVSFNLDSLPEEIKVNFDVLVQQLNNYVTENFKIGS